MYQEKDIELIKDLILDHVPNAEQIILFGSYARGDANQSSDIDFIVLTDSIIERKEKLKLISKIRWETTKLGFDIDILIKEKNVFLQDSALPTLSRVIKEEGKFLWVKN